MLPMKVQSLSLNGKPEEIVNGYSCVWLCLPKSSHGPLMGALSQWLDWQLQGTLSSRLAQGGFTPGPTVFLPMTQKTGFPYLAVEVSSAQDWELFAKNCEGQQWSRVLILCESEN